MWGELPRPEWHLVGVRKRAARAEEAGELQPGIKKILLYPPLLSLSLSKESRYNYPTGEKGKEVDYLTPSCPCSFE